MRKVRFAHLYFKGFNLLNIIFPKKHSAFHFKGLIRSTFSTFCPYLVLLIWDYLNNI